MIRARTGGERTLSILFWTKTQPQAIIGSYCGPILCLLGSFPGPNRGINGSVCMAGFKLAKFQMEQRNATPAFGADKTATGPTPCRSGLHRPRDASTSSNRGDNHNSSHRRRKTRPQLCAVFGSATTRAAHGRTSTHGKACGRAGRCAH